MRQIKEACNPGFLRVVDDITGVSRRWVLEWRDEVLARDAAIPFECLTRVNLATELIWGHFWVWAEFRELERASRTP